MENKLIGNVYVNILQDDKGEIRFAYGYEMKEEQLSLNDFSMLNSFLGTLRERAKQDFQERLDKNDKEFSIEQNPED